MQSESIILSSEKNNGKNLVLFHGFTSTPLSMLQFGEFFYKMGYNVEIPLLPGHGTRWEDLNAVKYEQWVEVASDTIKKYENMKNTSLFVAGLSMGGSLTLAMAERYKFIKGISLVNHLYNLPSLLMVFVPLLRLFVPYTSAIGGDIKKDGVIEEAYDRNPTNGLYQMMKLMRDVKKDIRKVNQPAIILKSKEDHVIPVKSSFNTYHSISSPKKKMVFLKDSYHVATLDNDAEKIFNETYDFFEEVLALQR